MGQVPYEATVERMRQFTLARSDHTLDEIWLLEHPPVYTLGLRGRNRTLQTGNTIPVVPTDRGGDVTYHGPGQIVLYTLIDLERRKLEIHALVETLEQSVIDVLAELKIAAARRKGAPGVYVENRKIASLGLRIRSGRSYHGLSFNVAMDLAPFEAIDPCGFPGLSMAQLTHWREDFTVATAGERLLTHALSRLGYTHPLSVPAEAGDPGPNARF
jgi:lipoyl(octanoyl) transferase